MGIGRGQMRPGRVVRRVLRAPVRLYGWGLGWLLGHRFLCLTHRGRRSGRTYRTVVEVVRFDRSRDECVVMSGLGRRSDWFRNVQAGGALSVQIGVDRFAPEVRVLDVDEAVQVLGDYERRNRLIAPVVRRVLSSMAGFRYDGSEAGRRKVVTELPLVAFRPATSDDPAATAEVESVGNREADRPGRPLA